MTVKCEKQCISIIVPLYHGRRFIGDILQQIKENARYLKGTRINIQLILYNDYPEETICVNDIQYDFEIKVINAENNRGIHGARVAALENADGEFILFLDQDDRIEEHYVISQLSKIENADAVVCRLFHGDKLHYTEYFKFEEVVTREFMIKYWCPIVSPGQVVIRKDAIPDIWKENILRNNGADDYFLWLCMAAERKEFVLNQEILFHHMLSVSNASLNVNQMMDSEQEMICILQEQKVFPVEERQMLKGLQTSLRRVHINELNNYRDSYTLYDFWLSKILIEKDPMAFFKERNIESLAIYGAGEIGKSLYKLLKLTRFVNVFFIDRNAEYIQADIPVYTLQDAPRGIDAVIVAVNKEPDLVKKELEQSFMCPVYQLKEILNAED